MSVKMWLELNAIVYEEEEKEKTLMMLMIQAYKKEMRLTNKSAPLTCNSR